MPINRKHLKTIIREELVQEKKTIHLVEKMDLLLEQVETLSPREVRSVLNGLGLTKTVILKKFQDYLKSQKSTPLGAAADKRVAEKVKKLAQVFSKIWDDFYNTGTASFVDTPEDEKPPPPHVDPPDPPVGPPETPGTGITKEDEAKIKAITGDAIRLLSLRLLTYGPNVYNDASVLRKHGNLIKKKFIYTRSLREVDAPTTPSPAPPVGGASDREITKAFMAMSKKNRITPKAAQENFLEIKDSINIRKILANLEWRMTDPLRGEPQDNDNKKLLDRVEYFIWSYAMKGDL